MTSGCLPVYILPDDVCATVADRQFSTTRQLSFLPGTNFIFPV